LYLLVDDGHYEAELYELSISAMWSSKRFLKLLSEGAAITRFGNEFDKLTILCEKKHFLTLKRHGRFLEQLQIMLGLLLNEALDRAQNATRHRASTEHSLTFRVRTMLSHREVEASLLFGWLEFNVPFQHKYGYIRDEGKLVTTVHVMLP